MAQKLDGGMGCREGVVMTKSVITGLVGAVCVVALMCAFGCEMSGLQFSKSTQLKYGNATLDRSVNLGVDSATKAE